MCQFKEKIIQFKEMCQTNQSIHISAGGVAMQPKFDAWANSGQPDSSATGGLALNCGLMHTCTCSFLYEHQYGVLKSACSYIL